MRDPVFFEWLLVLAASIGPTMGVTCAYVSGPRTMRRLADGGAVGGAIAGILLMLVLLLLLPEQLVTSRLLLLPLALAGVGVVLGAGVSSIPRILRRVGF